MVCVPILRGMRRPFSEVSLPLKSTLPKYVTEFIEYQLVPLRELLGDAPNVHRNLVPPSPMTESWRITTSERKSRNVFRTISSPPNVRTTTSILVGGCCSALLCAASVPAPALVLPATASPDAVFFFGQFRCLPLVRGTFANNFCRTLDWGGPGRTVGNIPWRTEPSTVPPSTMPPARPSPSGIAPRAITLDVGKLKNAKSNNNKPAPLGSSRRNAL